MQKLFILGCLLWLTACSKSTSHFTSKSFPETKRNFFKSPEEAFELVQRKLKIISPGEQVQSIQSISYTYAGNTMYAFVFYQSNKGNRNLVIKKEYNGDELINGSVTKCEVEGCNCLATVVIGNDGHIDVGCSCPTCKTITSQGLQ